MEFSKNNLIYFRNELYVVLHFFLDGIHPATETFTKVLIIPAYLMNSSLLEKNMSLCQILITLELQLISVSYIKIKNLMKQSIKSKSTPT